MRKSVGGWVAVHKNQPALGASDHHAQNLPRSTWARAGRQLQEGKGRFSQATVLSLPSHLCTSDRKPGKDTRCFQSQVMGAGDQCKWE